jgi:hypothetical protein
MKQITQIFTNTKVITALLLLLVLPSLSYANAGFDDDVMDTPIDGGLSLLVAAGVGYGAKQLRKARKEKRSEV